MAVRILGRWPTALKIFQSPGIWLLGLFVLGLVLRLAGLSFNGMHDVDELAFKWGSAVKEWGIARTFTTQYGVFSYVLYGMAATWGEQIARFWWLPYKLMEVLFESVVLLALYLLLPAGRRPWSLWMYWVNPWFILHGAWQGFWEGPHTALALMGVVCLARVRNEKLAWTLAGISFMAAAMFKPQGLVYFVVPVGIYLTLQLIRRRWLPLMSFVIGLSAVLAFAAGYLEINGGDFWQIPRNYLSVATFMPNLCNGCISIWRPITIILYAVLGPSKFVSTVGPLTPINNLLSLIAFCVAFALITLLAWRIPLTPERPRHSSVLLVLAFSSLVIPQLTTHAHINHAYAGLVLLIPFAVASRRLLVPWVGMVVIHLYSHLAVYQFGRSLIVPQQYLDYEAAQPLLSRINAAAVTQAYTPLLQFQASINQFVRHYLPVEPIVSQLSVIQFLCVIVIVYELFVIARTSLGRNTASVDSAG